MPLSRRNVKVGEHHFQEMNYIQLSTCKVHFWMIASNVSFTWTRWHWRVWRCKPDGWIDGPTGRQTEHSSVHILSVKHFLWSIICIILQILSWLVYIQDFYKYLLQSTVCWCILVDICYPNQWLSLLGR